MKVYRLLIYINSQSLTRILNNLLNSICYHKFKCIEQNCTGKIPDCKLVLCTRFCESMDYRWEAGRLGSLCSLGSSFVSLFLQQHVTHIVITAIAMARNNSRRVMANDQEADVKSLGAQYEDLLLGSSVCISSARRTHNAPANPKTCH